MTTLELKELIGFHSRYVYLQFLKSRSKDQDIEMAGLKEKLIELGLDIP